MSQLPDSTALKSQYAAQVAADLERNATEQERINSEIAALQDKVTELQKDHALLLSMQVTLGNEPSALSHDATRTSDEGPTTAEAAKEAPLRTARRAHAEEAGARKGGKKPTPTKAGEKAQEGRGPSLRELVFAQLSQRREPRSAVEITTELTQAHPDRTVNVTLVRNALEALVAKGQAQRNKQQRNVFYNAV